MKFGIKQKIIGLALLATILPVLVALILSNIQREKTRQSINSSVNRMIVDDLHHIMNDFYSLCKTANDYTQQNVNQSLNVARAELYRQGRVHLLSDKVHWQAINQFTQEVQNIRLPKIAVQNQWLGKNFSLKIPSPVVDRTKALVGGTCTIFQRINAEGDMLRVVTNVQKRDSSRAIGTYIPAINPDGSKNEVVHTVLSGQIYRGRAYVVNDWYLTAYEPITTDGGRIIGMLYVGVKLQSAQSFRQSIAESKVGKTGFLYALIGSGERQGQWVIAGNKKIAGQNAWQNRDTRGNPYIREIISEAKNLSAGKIGRKNLWLNQNGRQEKVITLFTYFEPWDWVIGAQAYEKDFAQIRQNVDQSLSALNRNNVLFGILIVLIMGGVALGFGNKIANPMLEVADSARALADGRLQKEIECRSKDETCVLANSFNQMARDLHREREALQSANKQLKEANATKDKMYAIVSHDLRNPFSSMRLLAELLYNDYNDFDEQERKEYIKHIKDASEYAFKLMEDLLQWSRLQREKFKPNPEIVHIADIIQEMIHLFRADAELKKIDMHSHVSEDITVYADFNMSKTIFRNLLNNALKFTGKDGRIDISAEKGDDVVRITVADSGVGMSETELQHLFKIDEAYSQRGTADEHGTGLGLLLCKEFVEMSGGTIEAESEPGQGSRFIITLPASEAGKTT
ncbi:MAG: HAMP domain-containing protein [Caldithrix sp.]|nr:HAMP domain-containing protein [Caldithrix sp.]